MSLGRRPLLYLEIDYVLRFVWCSLLSNDLYCDYMSRLNTPSHHDLEQNFPEPSTPVPSSREN